MKIYGGSGGIVLRTVILGSIWRWVVSFTLPLLYPDTKIAWHTLESRLGGPQNLSGRCGEEGTCRLFFVKHTVWFWITVRNTGSNLESLYTLTSELFIVLLTMPIAGQLHFYSCFCFTLVLSYAALPLLLYLIIYVPAFCHCSVFLHPILSLNRHS